MSAVKHIELPTASIMLKGKVAVSTRRESFTGSTPVVERVRNGGKVAWWGSANNTPQRIAQEIRETSIVGAIRDKKTETLVSGGLRYGKRTIDERTGLEMLRPMQVPEIDYWLQDTNSNLYNYEAARDFYTYANTYCEFQLGKGRNYCTGIAAADATHVRLGAMNNQGYTTAAYLADWSAGAQETDGSTFHAIDPYGRSPYRQILDGGKYRYIIPLRFLGDGQFYYGISPWHALRTNGWLDINKRVPELKLQLLEYLQHLSLWIEIDERYWPIKFPGWEKKEVKDRLTIMEEETTALSDSLSGKNGGMLMTAMLGSPSSSSNTQESLVKVTPIKNSVLSGVYIEDSQEADFVICRDMGLPPPLFGISPSKSGNSAGSGSADRILRTNHLLDSKPYADLILQPYSYVSRINGWDDKYNGGAPITWWFANYYAATLDRTMQVGDMDKHAPNTGN